MVPAMDRCPKPLVQAGLIGMGLALGLVETGCSRLNVFRKAPDPPMLGRVADTTDIYAMSRRPGSTPINPSMPGRSEISEVAVARLPAETEAEPTMNGVALQPPSPMAAQLSPRSMKPSDGVPNAGATLANAERRPTVTPADLIHQARAALDSMTSYEVALHRQERVNGSLLPEEDLVVAIRREPRAVRLTWPSGPNQGREVLYRADEPNGPMHVKMANPALPRLTLAPESPMVMRNSRHPVTEAGLDSIIEGLENALSAPTSSDLLYVGLEAADGLDQPQPCLQRTSPSGDLWKIYFDPNTHLPTLVLAKDSTGQLLENYLFHDVRPNVPELASTDAFDANARWGQPRGLFGRLAKGESPEPAEPPR